MKLPPGNPEETEKTEKTKMQQHDGRHPHNLRTAVLCLGQQKLLPASSQIDLHQRNDVGHQHQI